MATVYDLKALLKNNPTPAPVPYFAEFQLEGAKPSPGVDIEQYPGLLAYHLVRPHEALPRLHTFWESQEHYARDAEIFRASIGARPVAVSGYLTDLTSHTRPWWKRWQWHTVVLGIAAFLGAVQAIGNYYDWIFMGPYLGLKWDRTHLQLIQGAEFKESTTLVNNLPVAHRGIALSAALRAKSGSEKKADVVPALVPHLPGSASQEVIVTGVAAEPGEYDLVLGATASAGLVRSSNEFHFQRPVTVWPKAPAARLTVKPMRDRAALLSGVLAVGPAAPGGLECELEIKRMGGIAFDGLFEFYKLASPPRWRTNTSAGNEVALLTWQVQPTTGQEAMPFQIAFSSSANVDWSKLPERSTVRCNSR